MILCSGFPLVPFGVENGDIQVPVRDDDTAGPVSLTPYPYFGINETVIYVSIVLVEKKGVKQLMRVFILLVSLSTGQYQWITIVSSTVFRLYTNTI